MRLFKFYFQLRSIAEYSTCRFNKVLTKHKTNSPIVQDKIKLDAVNHLMSQDS